MKFTKEQLAKAREAKNAEELIALKKEVENLNKKRKKLTEDELAKISGGGGVVTCNRCNGTGYINNAPCRVCKGSGGIYDPNYVGPANPKVEIDIGNLAEEIERYLAENGQ